MSPIGPQEFQERKIRANTSGGGSIFYICKKHEGKIRSDLVADKQAKLCLWAELFWPERFCHELVQGKGETAGSGW